MHRLGARLKPKTKKDPSWVIAAGNACRYIKLHTIDSPPRAEYFVCLYLYRTGNRLVENSKNQFLPQRSSCTRISICRYSDDFGTDRFVLMNWPKLPTKLSSNSIGLVTNRRKGFEFRLNMAFFHSKSYCHVSNGQCHAISLGLKGTGNQRGFMLKQWLKGARAGSLFAVGWQSESERGEGGSFIFWKVAGTHFGGKDRCCLLLRSEMEWHCPLDTWQ